MKKTFICCVLCFCLALTGCSLRDIFPKEYIPLSTYIPGSKLYADTMGLLEAFTENEELRTLFEQAASGSMPLADHTKAIQYSYDYYRNGTNAYYGTSHEGVFTDESLRVDGKTADAINQIEELLPGVHVWMREVLDGKMCVVFSIVKNTTGEDDGYYDEQLFYSSEDLSEIEQYGNLKIGEGWWFFTVPMP